MSKIWQGLFILSKLSTLHAKTDSKLLTLNSQLKKTNVFLVIWDIFCTFAKMLQSTNTNH